MDQLLDALKRGDNGAVDVIACDLFITHEGRVNKAQVNEFERYAPCKIFPAEQDSFGWLIGGIRYGDKVFYFG